MKRRVEEMQTFPHTATRPGGNTAINRILTPPNITNPASATTPNQYHLMTVLKDQPVSNIQYTYTPSSITNQAGLQKSTNIGQGSNQVHVVNTTNLSMPTSAATIRSKPAASSAQAPTITTTPQPPPHVVTSPGSSIGTLAATAGQQNVGSQNFPRLKVEDALSYLDQVSYKEISNMRNGSKILLFLFALLG